MLEKLQVGLGVRLVVANGILGKGKQSSSTIQQPSSTNPVKPSKFNPQLILTQEQLCDLEQSMFHDNHDNLNLRGLKEFLKKRYYFICMS